MEDTAHINPILLVTYNMLRHVTLWSIHFCNVIGYTKYFFCWGQVFGGFICQHLLSDAVLFLALNTASDDLCASEAKCLAISPLTVDNLVVHCCLKLAAPLSIGSKLTLISIHSVDGLIPLVRFIIGMDAFWHHKQPIWLFLRWSMDACSSHLTMFLDSPRRISDQFKYNSKRERTTWHYNI